MLEADELERAPEFKKRLEWFLDHRPDLAALVSRWHVPGRGEKRLLSLLRGKHVDILNTIRDSRDLDDATAGKLKDVVDGFAKSFA